MDSEHELLKRYSSNGDEEAFAQLVRRYFNLVYSAALRQVREPYLAQDISQMVFANLARKAGSIGPGMSLAGWLHADARYTALEWLRRERRRARREEEHMHEPAPAEPSWVELQPLIDELLQSMAPAERDSILMRFFEDRTFEQMAASLGATPDAARMCVNRALERLRELFARRGVQTTSAALSVLLAANAVQAAPPAALAAALAMSPASALVLSTIVMTKTKAVLAGSALALGLATPFVFQFQTIRQLKDENAALAARWQEASAAIAAAKQQAASQGDQSRDLQAARTEISRLRAEVTRLHAEARAKPVAPQQAAAAPPPGELPPGPLTDADIQAFHARPAAVQGQVLGAIRRDMMQLKLDSTNGPAALELLTKVRGKLEDLESNPAAFADFQTEFVKTVTGISDEAKLAQMRQIIESTYTHAVQDGLHSAGRPADNIDDWARRRDALDRPATRAVQAILDEKERDSFDRSFLGIMGIDLGIKDGAWHRFSDDQGNVHFPSETASR